jgi:hypothetical protein
MFLSCSGCDWLRATNKRNLMQLVALHLPCKGECNRNLMSAAKRDRVITANVVALAR